MAALAGRLGGIAALDARTGEVRALAGIAFSAPQPPGSTFKIVTTTAALEEARQADDRVPGRDARARSTASSSRTRTASPAAAASRNSFAHSCNSVFAPLGVKVGAKKLVETPSASAGTSSPDPRRGAEHAPAGGRDRAPLELGSTAIGQFQTLATPLQIASVAQTIAADGVRYRADARAAASGRRAACA